MAFIAMLIIGALVTLAVLAVAVVAATDRVRAVADQLLATREVLRPALAELTESADAARAHAQRLRATRLRSDDEDTATG